MARNKFDVDERLESPFRWEHLKRAGKYIVRHKYKIFDLSVNHLNISVRLF